MGYIEWIFPVDWERMSVAGVMSEWVGRTAREETSTVMSAGR